MARGIACGCVGMMTAMAESRKMAAILQLMDWQRHAALVVKAYLFDFGHSCYGQLTLVKTRYPSISITRAHLGLHFGAQGAPNWSFNFNSFLKLTADQESGCDWIAQARLLLFLIGALILGLAKSIYYALRCVCFCCWDNLRVPLTLLNSKTHIYLFQEKRSPEIGLWRI